MSHPSEETLKRFVAGTASRAESRTIVAHLLKGCLSCTGQVRAFMEPAQVQRDDYDSALNRFDRGLVDALESSISPVQTLRTVLGTLLEDGEGREEP
ncbi:MAG TPA: hypothetical protein VF173_22015 [Thermoanaerobaculia bacterium]|nr:hypothetical protein [Thermoanaerobaculia bacterium]